MQDISELIQQLSPEQREVFDQKFMQGLEELKSIFEEAHKKDEKDTKLGYIILKNEWKLLKNQNQRIPYTDEEWEKSMEKQKWYKATKKKNREKLNNFIDNFFFEDGRALHLNKHTT